MTSIRPPGPTICTSDLDESTMIFRKASAFSPVKARAEELLCFFDHNFFAPRFHLNISRGHEISQTSEKGR